MVVGVQDDGEGVEDTLEEEGLDRHERETQETPGRVLVHQERQQFT